MIFIYRHLEKIILVALVVLAIGCYFISSFATPTFGGLLVNISAGCISSVLTILGIEHLRRKREAQRSTHIVESAEADVKKLSNMLVSYIASPLGSSAMNYGKKTGENSEVFGNRAIRLVLSEIQQRDLQRAMKSMSVADWNGFVFNIQWVRQSLLETIQIYSPALPPEIHGLLLKVRICFNVFSQDFIVLHDLFIKPEEEWPQNERGAEWNRTIREQWIETLSKDLREYFSAVNNLFGAIDQIYHS